MTKKPVGTIGWVDLTVSDAPAIGDLYRDVAGGRSVHRCRDKGGAVIVGPTEMAANGRFCVIRDPAGAVAALYQVAT